MELLRNLYRKVLSVILCFFSAVGLATGLKNLSGGEKKRLIITGEGDGRRAAYSAEKSGRLAAFLRFVATWSAITAAISTFLLALVRRYTEGK